MITIYSLTFRSIVGWSRNNHNTKAQTKYFFLINDKNGETKGESKARNGAWRWRAHRKEKGGQHETVETQFTKQITPRDHADLTIRQF